MGTVDLMVTLALMVGLAWGAWQGAGKQLQQLIAWVVSIAAAWYLAAPAARVMVRLFDVPYGVAYPLAGFLLSTGAYLTVKLALWWPTRQLEKDDDDDDGSTTVSVVNRSLGGLLGFSKLGVLIWAITSAVTLAIKPLQKFGYELPVDNSATLRWSHQHNLWAILFKDRLERLSSATAALGTGGKKMELSPQALEEIGTDPRVKALTTDPQLISALEQGDFTSLLQDERVLSLVSDDSLTEKLLGALAGSQ